MEEKNSRCVICNQIITSDTDSREHIIPNSIGGRKKVSGFLCVTCNSECGDKWDKSLARQMNPLSLYFRITRERGVAPSQKFNTDNEKEIVLHSDGSLSQSKPEVCIQESENNVNVSVSARDLSEFKKIMKGIANKYPESNVQDLLGKASLESNYLSESIRFDLSFGGIEEGKSIVKSALSLVHLTGVDAAACEHAMSYLLEDSEPCFGYYYEYDMVSNRPEGVPFHCVHVKGSSKNGHILAYVEYFGIMRVVMCLSSDYLGEPFESTYSLDPRNGRMLELDIKLGISLKDIRDAYNYEKWDGDNLTSSLNSLMSYTQRDYFKKEQNRVIEEAVNHGFKSCSIEVGENMTREKMNVFLSEMWVKLEPYVMSRIKK